MGEDLLRVVVLCNEQLSLGEMMWETEAKGRGSRCGWTGAGEGFRQTSDITGRLVWSFDLRNHISQRRTNTLTSMNAQLII